MDDYKGFILFGNDEENYSDGQVVMFGDIKSDDLHIANLLEVANTYFPNDPILSRLTIHHSPEVVAYFISTMGNIVFLNLTKYNGNNVSRHGKSGLLMLPDEVTEKQIETLKELGKDLEAYDLIIKTNLKLNEGLLESKTLACMTKLNPERLAQMVRDNSSVSGNKPIKH